MSLFGNPKYSVLSRPKKKEPAAHAPGFPPHSGEHKPPATHAPRKSQSRIPDGVFDKCSGCGESVFKEDLALSAMVCPHCSYHRPITAQKRIELLTDAGSFSEIDANMASIDILEFQGKESYPEKLEKSRQKTGMNDAIVCGFATLNLRRYALGVMDFRFMGASMGSVVGEKIARLAEAATTQKIPLVIVTASGGARMQEGMFSLMQMAKTSGAVHRHAKAGLPYIVIMTHPTTAGVTASFASLGDIIIAEPNAQIGFAGERVIQATTQASLPDGFQTSAFLLKKGMIDRVVSRGQLRHELSLIIEYFAKACEGEKVGDIK